MSKKPTASSAFYAVTGVVYFSLFLALFTVSFAMQDIGSAKDNNPRVVYAETPSKTESSLLDRFAARLHRAAGLEVSSERALKLLEDRAELLTRGVVVHLRSEDGSVLVSVPVMLKDHPTWIKIDTSSTPRLAFNLDQIRQGILRLTKDHIQTPRDCHLSAVERDEFEVLRAKTDCIAQAGITYNMDHAVEDFIAAVNDGAGEITIALVSAGGSLYIDPSLGMEFPDLLATGTSNFKGSPWGRKTNIHKAIEQHIHNVIIPSGEELSFNSLLSGRVTQSAGWAMALGIFEGGDLRPTPGGGICQTSTTVYRAALAAGLPITVQRNHSLFVHYYEQGGVGLDATVFYGYQDLKFVNDTGYPILIQAYVAGDDVTVEFFGHDDGRRTVLNGPFVLGNTAEIQVNGRPIRGNEIVWTREVTHADSKVTQDQIVSRYKSVPNYVKKAIIRGEAFVNR